MEGNVFLSHVSFWMLSFLILTDGHGRLLMPPSRASMWRFGFEMPMNNYDDNQGYCGGREQLWGRFKGRCGVCGDPVEPRPRAHERGGRYYVGTVVKTYNQGDIIEAEMEFTANHRGWVEFRLCDYDNPDPGDLELDPQGNFVEVSQQCLDKHPLILADGSGSRYMLPEPWKVGIYKVRLRLPQDVVCERCLFQWKYNTGNSWGRNNDGTSCVGCGVQEQFYACSDIKIKASTNPGQFTNRPTFIQTLQPPIQPGNSIVRPTIQNVAVPFQSYFFLYPSMTQQYPMWIGNPPVIQNQHATRTTTAMTLTTTTTKSLAHPKSGSYSNNWWRWFYDSNKINSNQPGMKIEVVSMVEKQNVETEQNTEVEKNLQADAIVSQIAPQLPGWLGNFNSKPVRQKYKPVGQNSIPVRQKSKPKEQVSDQHPTKTIRKTIVKKVKPATKPISYEDILLTLLRSIISDAAEARHTNEVDYLSGVVNKLRQQSRLPSPSEDDIQSILGVLTPISDKLVDAVTPVNNVASKPFRGVNSQARIDKTEAFASWLPPVDKIHVSSGTQGSSMGKCEPLPPWRENAEMIDWCSRNCRTGNCSPDHCNSACMAMYSSSNTVK